MSNQPKESDVSSIEEKLVEAWRQEQRFFNLRGGARFLIWLVALLLIDFLIDWQIFFRERLEVPGILLLVINLAVLVWVLWHEWFRFRKPYDSVRVALEVENKHPELRSVLVSFTQLKDVDAEEIQASPSLLNAMRDQAISLTRPLDFREVVDLRQLKNLGVVCLLSIGFFSAISLQWEDHMRALFLRLLGGDANYPTETTITSVSRDFTIKLGDSAEIVTEVNSSKKVPPTGTLYWRSEGAKEAWLEITVDNRDRYIGEIEKITKETQYRLEIGDDRTDWFTISVSPKPVFTATSVTLTYPEYLDLNDSTEEALDLSVPEGTTIKWTLQCDPAITDLNITVGEEKFAAEVSVDGTTAVFSWPKPGTELTKGFTYNFHYIKDKKHGFEYEVPGEQEVVVIRDRVPEIELLEPTTNGYATTKKILEIVAQAKDDHELGEASLLYTINNRQQKRVSFEKLTGKKLSETKGEIRIRKPLSEFLDEDEELKPGGSFAFEIEVSDKVPPLGSHINLSSERKLTILSEENYLRWFNIELEKQRELIAKARDSEKSAEDKVGKLKAEEKKE